MRNHLYKWRCLQGTGHCLDILDNGSTAVFITGMLLHKVFSFSCHSASVITGLKATEKKSVFLKKNWASVSTVTPVFKLIHTSSSDIKGYWLFIKSCMCCYLIRLGRMGASASTPAAPTVRAEAMMAVPPQECPMHQEAKPVPGSAAGGSRLYSIILYHF